MEYPVHHETHIVNPAIRKPKKEALIEFYVDIEGTLIDNLWDANFLYYSCENIKEYIHKHDGHDYKVNIFTWGWTHREQIELELVDNLYKRLGIDKIHRGTIFVKADSVDVLLKKFPDMPFDCNELMQTGGFMRYSIRKPYIWKLMVDSVNKFNVLIDDTVSSVDQNSDRVKFINPARMKVTIRNKLDTPATLYTPDDCEVGVIENSTAFSDVRRQIAAQHLSGYYVMFNNERVDIDCEGSPMKAPYGFFDTVIDAAGDLLVAEDQGQRETLFKNIEHIYPQPINPDISDD